ncbi:MAG: hypothetical protein Q9188_005613, partial [Gyalolechia gomerana]
MDNREVEQQPHNLNTTLLCKLSTAVNVHAATATFACGGSVPIIDGSAVLDLEKELQALLKRCGRATFGIGGRDVLGESYRKANKLDATLFSSNFHPHDCGLVDSGQQILLASTLRGSSELVVGPQPIRAELYKLNVSILVLLHLQDRLVTTSQIYSGPKGKFRSHVDTPRGPTQFGSLVLLVCILALLVRSAVHCALKDRTHLGGALRVKHQGQTIDFDWANATLGSVHWAAFYGDCEHEVLEATEGHRVTMTYKLYYTSFGDLDQRVHLTDRLPLYSIVHDMLEEPTFLRGVGVYPIIKNKAMTMGGMSVQPLNSDSYDECEGDYVESFLEKLIYLPDEEYNKKYRWAYPGKEEYRTIVGKRLHGPTFDDVQNNSDDVSERQFHGITSQ